MNNNEVYKKRNLNNSRFEAYIPNYIAEPFKKKLQENGLKFSEWLKENIEKYLKKN